jgi:hypothetical protein
MCNLIVATLQEETYALRYGNVVFQRYSDCGGNSEMYQLLLPFKDANPGICKSAAAATAGVYVDLTRNTSAGYF